MEFLVRRRRRLARRIHRLIAERMRAGVTGPKVLVNSIPKAGTHLLIRCLTLFPGIIDAGCHVEETIGLSAMKETLQRLGGGCLVSAHLPFTDERSDLLANLGFATALIIRDPRDLVVSHLYYVTYGAKHHRLHAYYNNLPDDPTRLMASILGVDSTLIETGEGLLDIGERFRCYLLWADHGSCIVRFENLVGPDGGGNRELQVQEIQKLAAHLRVGLDDKDVEHIAKCVFYRKSKTFRKGLIGDWRNHFTQQHKAAFKEVAGQLLVDLGYETGLNW